MVHHVPAGQHTVVANLVVRDGSGTLDFYRRAFGAEVLVRLEQGGALLYSEVRVGDVVLTVSDEMPEYGIAAPDPDGPVPVSVTLWVPAADAAVARAVDAGATPVSEPADQFHGDRTGTVRDPSGHRWIVATHLEDLTEDDLRRRTQEWLAAAQG